MLVIKMAEQGDNFGLNENYDYWEIYLDSNDASLAYTNNFYYTDWPLFQFATPIPNLAAMKIIEVQIPFTWYTVNEYNYQFLLTEGATTVTVTLPVGNYNSTSLGTALATALSLVSPTIATYTVSFSGQNSVPNTGKFTIINGNSTPFTLTFGGPDDLGSTNPRFVLGMAEATNTSSLSGVLVAPRAANIAGPNYLYLNSRSIGTILKNVLPLGAEALGAGSIGPQLAKIPVNVQPGGVIYWSDPDPQKWFALENLALLPQMDMYITVGNSDQGQCTSLNGVPFSVKLALLTNKSISTKQKQNFSKISPY